jgi:3-oxoadipate enol-lactonase
MARDHPETVAGVVFAATSTAWQDPRQKLLWRGLALVRLALGLAPQAFWQRGLKLLGFPESPVTTWTTAELTRGSSVDLAEAGHELSRFDSRPWIAELEQPAAVIVTAKDDAVPPDRQRDLGRRLEARIYEVDGDHGACIARHREFNAALLQALVTIGDTAAAAA